jgi:hypothetical protein
MQRPASDKRNSQTAVRSRARSAGTTAKSVNVAKRKQSVTHGNALPIPAAVCKLSQKLIAGD